LGASAVADRAGGLRPEPAAQSQPVGAHPSRDPYLIEGPALISFSGGRTSGYMLRMILDAHGGTLPDDVHVCFANTGKEREETLRFVHDCATHWGVRVRWLEWRPPYPGIAREDRFAEVGFNSADREGVWFAELIRRKQYLPNPIMRYCTIELKIRVMRDFMLAQGYDRWNNAVGLRADEMHRVFKAIERNESGKERFKTVMPMANAKHRLADVEAFWREQPFDLALRPHEGNCDLCFLKDRDKRAAIIRERPDLADWWQRQEDTTKSSKPDGARFRKDETYRQLVTATLNSPLLPLEPDNGEFDAECGLWCAGEAA
jgi:3'-phosphoadenosine 5'-phosphosulfate sulfotransferase (PAPS reductase)/FAD synthetase